MYLNIYEKNKIKLISIKWWLIIWVFTTVAFCSTNMVANMRFSCSDKLVSAYDLKPSIIAYEKKILQMFMKTFKSLCENTLTLV